MLATLALSLALSSSLRSFVRSFVEAEMNRKVKIARGRKIPCKVSGGGGGGGGAAQWCLPVCARMSERPTPAESGT